MANKVLFTVARRDPEMMDLIGKTPQKILASWAIDCAHRVLLYFEEIFPDDRRPHKALETLRTWIHTGEFHMSVIRNASLDAHSAARDVGHDIPARSAARACGQAVATAHVPRHAYGAAIYAQQALFRATGSLDEVEKERNWQFERLRLLNI